MVLLGLPQLDLAAITRMRTRLLLCAVTFSVIFGAALIYVYSRPFEYQVSAKIWVQSQLPTETVGSQTSTIYSPFLYFWNSPIVTSGEVMGSSVVIQEALAQVQREDPSLQLPCVGEAQWRLKVEPVKDADIIEVSYHDRDAQRAYKITQAIIDAFIKISSSEASDSAANSRQFLEEQLDAATKRYKEVSADLKKFQEAHHAVDIANQTEIDLKSIDEMSRQLDDEKARLSEAQSKARFIASQIRPNDNKNLVDVDSQDIVVKRLREKIADDEVKLLDLRSKLTEDDPRVQRLEADLSNHRKALRQHLQSQLKMERTNENYHSSDNFKEKLLTELSTAKSDEMSAQTRIAILSAALANKQAKIKDFPTVKASLQVLTRQEAEAEQLVSDLNKSLRTARMSEKISTKFSNIKIIDRPGIPGAPDVSGAMKKIAIGGAGAFGISIFLYVVLLLLDPCIHNSRDVANCIDIPVVGWMKEVSSFANTRQEMSNLQRIRLAIADRFKNPGKEVVIIASSDPDKSTTEFVTFGLGLAFAREGSSVIMVDANLAQPGFADITKPHSLGLLDYICSSQNAPLSEFLQTVGDKITLLPAGSIKDRDFIPAATLMDIISQLHSYCDVVLVRTPSIRASSDALELGVHMNSILLLTVFLDRAHKESLKLLAAQLNNEHVPEAVAMLYNSNLSKFALSVRQNQPTTEVVGEASPAW